MRAGSLIHSPGNSIEKLCHLKQCKNQIQWGQSLNLNATEIHEGRKEGKKKCWRQQKEIATPPTVAKRPPNWKFNHSYQSVPILYSTWNVFSREGYSNVCSLHNGCLIFLNWFSISSMAHFIRIGATALNMHPCFPIEQEFLFHLMLDSGHTITCDFYLSLSIFGHA